MCYFYVYCISPCFFFFSSRRRHTRYWRDWSSDVCSSDLRRGRGLFLERSCFPLRPTLASTPVASSGALQQSRKHFKTRMKTRLLLPWAMLLAPALAFAIPTEKELSP